MNLGALITAILFFAQAPPAATSSNVQGRICEVRTCKPIPGARVLLTVVGQPDRRKAAVSDLAGSFRFAQLSAGEYRMTVEADNYALSSILSVLTVSDGVNNDGLKIEMRPLGIISGHAFDETGGPLAGARIEALAFRSQGYFRALSPIAAAETDDRGVYRIPMLEPDGYYIRVLPPERIVRNTYPITYYPNATDAAGAAKIVVEEGDEISNIDPKVTSPGVHVRGRVVFPDNEKTQATVLLLPRSSTVPVLPIVNLNNSDQTDDRFELRGIASGSYYLYAITRVAPISSQWVRLPIDVGDKDAENVEVPIIRAGTIKGRIIIASDASDGDKLDLSSIRLMAGTMEIVPGTPRNTAATQTTKGGDFEFARLPEMRMFLRDRILSDNWFISSARFDGDDAVTNGFTTSPGKESVLEVVISNASGALAGVVKDRLDKPVPAGRVVLLPEGPRRSNPFLIRTTVAIEQGAYTVDTLPPGEYRAIAFPDADQFTPAYLRDMENVAKYEVYGQSVRIGPKETTRMDLTIVPGETK